MDAIERKYERVLKEARDDERILGVFLGGSRAKDASFVTPDSDIDIYVIVADDAPESLVAALTGYAAPDFEIRVLTHAEFAAYADWGSDREWDKYNFVRNKAVIDKTGDIQRLIDEKATMPDDKRRKIIEEALDCYVNNVYRSAKYWRDGNAFAAYLDATESLPFLMTALYALEWRFKPYNKYFLWELERFPLKLLPWPPREFAADYKHILETGDIETQKKMYAGIRKLFSDNGFKKVIDDWAGHYVVGE